MKREPSNCLTLFYISRLPRLLPRNRALIRTTGAALLLLIVSAIHSPAVDSKASAPSTIRIGLTRSKEHKFLFSANAPGGTAWFELDTGAPFTCADSAKTALFKFQPVTPGTFSSTIMMNGQTTKKATVPQIDFGGFVVKNLPVALIDLAGINLSHQRNKDRLEDGIFGLDALRRYHAVIDCGAGKLFLHPNPVRQKIPDGWRVVPMRLVDEHLLIPVTLNGFETSFVVDTGAPTSVIDNALCQSQRFPVGAAIVSMKSINHDLKAARANISDFRIGDVALGQTSVTAFDLTTVAGVPGAVTLSFTGMIGAETLSRLKAIIDCDAMQLYIKQPGRGGLLDF